MIGLIAHELFANIVGSVKSQAGRSETKTETNFDQEQNMYQCKAIVLPSPSQMFTFSYLENLMRVGL